MTKKIYVLVRGKKEGPYNYDEIREKLDRGEVGLFDSVMENGRVMLIKQVMKEIGDKKQEDLQKSRGSEIPQVRQWKPDPFSTSTEHSEGGFTQSMVGQSDTRQGGGLWAKLMAGIAGAVSLILLFYNVGVLSYNTYLQTDQAAIKLIKESMEQTLAEDPDVSKPVRVVEVKLEGSGLKRKGKALIEFAGKPESIPFKVDISRSIFKGVEVRWEITDEVDGSDSAGHSREYSTKKTDSEPSNESSNKLEELLSNFIKVATQIDVLNQRLFNPESQLTDQETNRLLSDLINAWKDLNKDGIAISQLISAAQEETLDLSLDEEKALKTFNKTIGVIKTSGPAIEALLMAALETTDAQVYQANMKTYFELSMSVNEAIENP